jgi:hypothetical protein
MSSKKGEKEFMALVGEDETLMKLVIMVRQRLNKIN